MQSRARGGDDLRTNINIGEATDEPHASPSTASTPDDDEARSKAPESSPAPPPPELPAARPSPSSATLDPLELQIVAEVAALLQRTRKRKLEIVEREAEAHLEASTIADELTSWERDAAPSPSSLRSGTTEGELDGSIEGGEQGEETSMRKLRLRRVVPESDDDDQPTPMGQVAGSDDASDADHADAARA